MRENDTHINYTMADIQRYNNGSMTAMEMHDMERAALQDPFLADAIEGIAEADIDVANKHLNEITALLQPKKEQAKIIPMQPRTNSWLRVAAIIVVIVGVGLAGIFLLNNNDNAKQVALAENAALPKRDVDSVKVLSLAPSATTATDTQLSVESNNQVADESEQKGKILAEQKSKKEAAPAMEKEEDDKQILPLARPAAPMANNNKDTEKAKKKSSYFTEGNLYVHAEVAKKVSGVVVDTKQKPVPNATVKLADSSIAVTDKNGEFDFNLADSGATANITAFGYKSATASLGRSMSDTIILKEKRFVLSEVPETNLRTQNAKRKDTSAAAAPVGGWQSFQEYVYKKLNKTYDSTHSDATVSNGLELEFSIDDEGLPYNFKVLQPADAQVTNDAIKAITEGPKWVPSKESKKARIRIKF